MNPRFVDDASLQKLLECGALVRLAAAASGQCEGKRDGEQPVRAK
jgi:hypothetical protein